MAIASESVRHQAHGANKAYEDHPLCIDSGVFHSDPDLNRRGRKMVDHQGHKITRRKFFGLSTSAQEQGHPFSRFDSFAIGRNHHIAVASSQCSDVARALPSRQFDLGILKFARKDCGKESF